MSSSGGTGALSRPSPAIVLLSQVRLLQRAVQCSGFGRPSSHPAIRVNGLPRLHGLSFLIVWVGSWTLTGTLAGISEHKID
ncbi:hypothetical protein E2C01_102005 [Portunus trituberculatus]|uniref:Uncharacterized protein n=1 Tax=Portunus trituberculatus TaxID=210409 RepID=A0A5B7KG91_PORTR|nr:hypothetical protein [Portunus trituberculatus]